MDDRWRVPLFVVLGLVFTVAVLSASFTAMMWVDHRKPDVPAPVVNVIEVDDPVIATYQMLLGEWQMEREQWNYVVEKQAKTIGLALDGLVEEIRKGR